jgi:uncharacterized protein YfaT (DUF1175 family)
VVALNMASPKRPEPSLKATDNIRQLEKLILSSNENLNNIVTIMKLIEVCCSIN